MTTDEHFQQQASELVLHDLVDCLFAEQFFAGAEQQLISLAQLQTLCAERAGLSDRIPFPALPSQGLIWLWSISKAPLYCVLVPVVRGIVQSIQRIRTTPVYAVKLEPGDNAFRVCRLDAVSFMKLVIAHAPDSVLGGNKEGASLFLEWLEEAVRQTAWSMDHNVDARRLVARDATEFFQTLEQCAALRDRPFHPVAKAKKGLVKQDYRHYMAEFGHDIRLNWVAVDRKYLIYGEGVSDLQRIVPAQFLLTEEQRTALGQEMRRRGIWRSHIPLPVHPWQLRHILPEQFASEFRSGACLPLDFQQASFLPTSSVRSMVPRAVGGHHVKLPLGIYSLGASRYLPAVKLINGQRSEKLLNQALGLDGVLAQRLFICDETKWWALMRENGSLFDEAPRHLSAMVRSYPAWLAQDPDYRLIPMAALGALLADQERHFFDEWMECRQLAPADHASVLMLFEEICSTFLDINLRMFRIGMLPEMHGQNAVLVWHRGNVAGLLLRDHDSLRVYVPWLIRSGLADPEYRLRAGRPNTLYHETPDDLLFYLQTLGIQVNLRAIIEALAIRFHIAEVKLWSVLCQVLEEIVARPEFPQDVRDLLHRRLFHDSAWPLKLLVKPLIERAGGPGSMPFGKGETQNPFHHLGEPAGMFRELGERQKIDRIRSREHEDNRLGSNEPVALIGYR